MDSRGPFIPKDLDRRCNCTRVNGPRGPFSGEGWGGGGGATVLRQRTGTESTGTTTFLRFQNGTVSSTSLMFVQCVPILIVTRTKNKIYRV